MSVKNKTILPECKIVIIKITAGQVACTHPCTMCTKLLNKYKLNNIYTLKDGKMIKI